MKEKTNKMPFDERVLYIVRNFYEYDSYGKNELKAIKTLHKYHPEYDLAYCSSVFKEYHKTFTDTVDFVELHKDSYWEQYNNNSYDAHSGPDEKERAFITLHDTVGEPIILMMINWVFHWHHVR